MVLLLTVLAKESEMFCLNKTCLVISLESCRRSTGGGGGGGGGGEGEERKGTGRGAKRMIWALQKQSKGEFYDREKKNRKPRVLGFKPDQKMPQ